MNQWEGRRGEELSCRLVLLSLRAPLGGLARAQKMAQLQPVGRICSWRLSCS